MCRIDLHKLMDGSSLPDSGSKLYAILAACDDKVVLDMTGVTSLPSMFLNVSIGKLIEERGREFLKKISFTNISRVQADRLSDYVNTMSRP